MTGSCHSSPAVYVEVAQSQPISAGLKLSGISSQTVLSVSKEITIITSVFNNLIYSHIKCVAEGDYVRWQLIMSLHFFLLRAWIKRISICISIFSSNFFIPSLHFWKANAKWSVIDIVQDFILLSNLSIPTIHIWEAYAKWITRRQASRQAGRFSPCTSAYHVALTL